MAAAAGAVRVCLEPGRRRQTDVYLLGVARICKYYCTVVDSQPPRKRNKSRTSVWWEQAEKASFVNPQARSARLGGVVIKPIVSSVEVVETNWGERKVAGSSCVQQVHHFPAKHPAHLHSKSHTSPPKSPGS